MKTAQPLNYQKYTSLRTKLAQQDSSAESQTNEIPELLTQLLPAYYQYRRYLVQMLKQATTNTTNVKMSASIFMPQQMVEEKLRRCEEERKVIQERKKNNGSARVGRMLVTEKLVHRRRKKLREEKELQRKYQAQEIQALISRQNSTKRVEEQHTFEPKRYRLNTEQRASPKNFQKLSQRLLYNDQPQAQPQPEPQSPQTPQKQNQLNSSILEVQRQIQKLNNQKAKQLNNRRNKSRIGEEQKQDEDSLNSSKIMETMKRSNVNVVETSSLDQIVEKNQGYEQERQKQREEGRKGQGNKLGEGLRNNQEILPRNPIKNSPKNKNIPFQDKAANNPNKSKAIPHNETHGRSSQNRDRPSRYLQGHSSSIEAPKIRINYFNKDSQSQPESQLSQDADFSDIAPNPQSKATANIIEAEHHDDTYSQHKAKPYTRHNTPNFDTFSQRVRPNNGNFYDLQRQKLQAQRKYAEKIRNQVSVVLGEDQEEEDGTGDRGAQGNLVLENLDMENVGRRKTTGLSTGRLSAREFADEFLSSIRYIFSQICQLFSLAECYKFIMKNKQYEILKRLYSEQLGKGPIFAKNLTKNIEALLKNQLKEQVSVILNKIFGVQVFISFQDFGKAFASVLYQNQFAVLGTKVTQINPYELDQLLSRLFSIWLEINYFQVKIRKIAQTNSMEIGQICTKVTRMTDQNLLDLQQFQKFVYSTTRNRQNSLKIKLFCAKYFPTGRFSELATWLGHKSTHK